MSDSECVITRDNIASNDPIDAVNIAERLVGICDSRRDAIQFLEKVIVALDPFHAPKKRPLAYEGKNEADTSNLKIARPEDGSEHPHADVINDLYDDESRLDSAMITLCVMIPNDVQLCSYLIGKKGANVADIRKRTMAKTQIEQSQDLPVGCPDRHVFFMGTIRAVCEAFQLVLSRMMDKADSLPPSTLDSIRMVVPTDLCAPLIGRGGVVIKKIQTDSGAHTHVQSEEDMRQMRHFFGRVINITGSLRQQCHAMLLLLKQVGTSFPLMSSWYVLTHSFTDVSQLLQLKDFPDSWRGGIPASMGGLPMRHLMQQKEGVATMRYQQAPQLLTGGAGGLVQGGLYFVGGGGSAPGALGISPQQTQQQQQPQPQQWISVGGQQQQFSSHVPQQSVAQGSVFQHHQQQPGTTNYSPLQPQQQQSFGAPYAMSTQQQQQQRISSYSQQQQFQQQSMYSPQQQHQYQQHYQQQQQSYASQPSQSTPGAPPSSSLPSASRYR
jgi:hypothetical protein